MTLFEEKKLIQAAKLKDKKAINRLIEISMDSIRAIAYKTSYRSNLIDIDELINEGVLSVYYAIDKFDLKKNVKFITYASWWFKVSIWKYVREQSNSVCLPEYLRIKINTVKTFKNSYFSKNGVEPNASEIINATHISEKTLNYISIFDAYSISIDDKREQSDGKQQNVIELMSYEEGYGKIEDNLFAIQYMASCEKYLSTSEIDILKDYFGIGREILTISEICKKHKCSDEHIRVIKNNAIIKLRNSKLEARFSQNCEQPQRGERGEIIG